jgi:hypothetical protein
MKARQRKRDGEIVGGHLDVSEREHGFKYLVFNAPFHIQKAELSEWEARAVCLAPVRDKLGRYVCVYELHMGPIW